MPNKNKKSELFVLIISILFILVGIYFTLFYKPKPEVINTCSSETPIYCTIEEECRKISLFWWNDSCHLSTEEKSKPSEFADYNYYLEMKSLDLVPTPIESWVREPGKIKDNEKIEKRFIKQNGHIANAYLFVDVSVDDGKPLTIWDSIHVSLQRIAINYNNEYPYKPFLDGHLLRSKSIGAPEGSTTRLLYDLRNVPFTTIPYSDKNEPVYKDWVKMLNNEYTDGYKIDEESNEIIYEFKTFLSTLRKGGSINRITIGYECAEETPDCKLSLVEE